jgi:sterol desaturase/sphingolipid hydroxylase (fatty acid hydroxylase superfamily)
MARAKLIARKHIHVPPCRNVVPTESHSDGQNAGYFPSTLWTVLLALGYSEPPLLIGVPMLVLGNSYLWCVHVIIYEWPTTDRIHRIHHVVEATTPR